MFLGAHKKKYGVLAHYVIPSRARERVRTGSPESRSPRNYAHLAFGSRFVLGGGAIWQSWHTWPMFVVRQIVLETTEGVFATQRVELRKSRRGRTLSDQQVALAIGRAGGRRHVYIKDGARACICCPHGTDAKHQRLHSSKLVAVRPFRGMWDLHMQ